MSIDRAGQLAWEYTQEGAALGVIHPQLIHKMFDQTYKAVPEENWKRAHDFGLDIPAEPDVMSYEETEEGENEAFMAYCRECCPDLYSVLNET